MPVYPDDGNYTFKEAGPQLSTDSWADLVEVDVQDWPRKFLRYVNENVNGNSVDVRVLGSLDYGANFPLTLVASTSIGAGNESTDRVPEAVSTIKVQIKATSGGSQDEISVDMGLANPAASA
jgi:hypothetical protein